MQRKRKLMTVTIDPKILEKLQKYCDKTKQFQSRFIEEAIVLRLDEMKLPKRDRRQFCQSPQVS